jgi:2-succinyl-5-enolpyruvyl-6-hydroxy-3-cyclohexene-1-carboxylate synthase
MGDADHPVTAAATFAAALVDEWVRRGLSHVVVCPGSRSTPLAVAFASDPRLRVEVHQDERSAAFIALGLGMASGRPAAVLTTSGTATANLFPAVAEAAEAVVPLLVLTADRPPELHGVGAPQTIDQQELFGNHVRHFEDAGVADDTDPSEWRSLARRVLEHTCRPLPGPVQLNVPFREPLVGSPGSLPPAAAADEIVDATPTRDDESALAGLAALVESRRVLVVAGHPVGDPALLLALCEDRGWPVLADPRSGLAGPGTIARFDSLLRVADFAADARPDVVLRIGSLPASRVLAEWLGGLDAVQIGIDPWGRTFDTAGVLDRVVCASASALVQVLAASSGGVATVDDTWSKRWHVAEAAAEQALTAELGPGDADQLAEPMVASDSRRLDEPTVARVVTAAARDAGRTLVVSSSMPIRDVEWFGERGGVVLANRGANGIDGVISTAVGVALAGDPVTVLLGDLAFLHDSNGLLGAPDRGIDLTIVVVDNDGGGIFSFLPQRQVLDGEIFEQLFGTPHHLDLVAVSEAFGVAARSVDSVDELRDALSGSTPELRTVVARTDRTSNIEVHERLQAAVAAAVTALGSS